MGTDLKTILERVETWPKDAQDELIRSMTEIETRYGKVYHVDDAERAALKRSGEDVRKRRFASDDDVDAVDDFIVHEGALHRHSTR